MANEERVTHLESQLNSDMQHREDIQNLVTELQKQLEDKKKENENSEKLLQELQKQLEYKKKENKNLKEVIKELQKRSEDKKKEERNLQEQIKKLQKRLEDQKKQYDNNLQEKLKEVTALEGKLTATERQVNDLEARVAEKEKQVIDLQGELTARERQINYLRREQLTARDQEVTDLQRQLAERDQQVAHLREQLERTLSTAQQTLDDYRPKEPCHWVVSRDEIHLTKTRLGVGAWATVTLGRFRRCKVAVKQIHELILSRHNRRLFEREMNIASRCRHPCLLQFIGATNEKSPLFVTELMESSLRKLLEQGPLTQTDISVISLDVAQALNYLHRSEPPIIHRDVSSANVLLWRNGNQWRGKVSDYGTANFMQQARTISPGAMIYSSPEARTSSQTVKMDVYSFGVLLCEMCIGVLPDPKERKKQVDLVTNQVFRGLIRRCIKADPASRPTMEGIIDDLDSLRH